MIIKATIYLSNYIVRSDLLLKTVSISFERYRIRLESHLNPLIFKTKLAHNPWI